ncbi:DUF3634 family protein [Gammaproteobacteria bacterium AB-CW1]|uniref:DUF3634 family protein n=1 Tax=Natronospira elongata TaxID=3110268 RepID=A0AAP6JDM2_9GAMM|nr:DUF3634 family protein [Gammaproteobacteria bacterium AB-CW1]
MSARLSIWARLAGVRGRIRFRDGSISEARGQLSPGFLAACRDIARLHRVSVGRVDVMGQGRRQHLRFSRDLPAGARQAISNVWTPPPSGGGGGMRAAG